MLVPNNSMPAAIVTIRALARARSKEQGARGKEKYQPVAPDACLQRKPATGLQQV
jgi:hypothetical protein